MTHTDDVPQGTLFDTALLGFSVLFLCHLVAAVAFGGPLTEGVVFWCPIIGVCLSGRVFVNDWVRVALVTTVFCVGVTLMTTTPWPVSGSMPA